MFAAMSAAYQLRLAITCQSALFQQSRITYTIVQPHLYMRFFIFGAAQPT